MVLRTLEADDVANIAGARGCKNLEAFGAFFSISTTTPIYSNTINAHTSAATPTRFQFRLYSVSVLLSECHVLSAAPVSSCSRRGPRSYFRSECCTGGKSVAAPQESNPVCQHWWRVLNQLGRFVGSLCTIYGKRYQALFKVQHFIKFPALQRTCTSTVVNLHVILIAIGNYQL